MAVDQLTVLLFDVDGVIVDPRAYKIGVAKSLELLCTSCGIPEPLRFLPDENEIAYMEAKGVHDVWDITNIMFAEVLVACFESFVRAGRIFEFQSAETSRRLNEISSRLLPELESSAAGSAALEQAAIERPDYRHFADSLSGAGGRTHPPDIALSLLSLRLEGMNSVKESWQSLLSGFLSDTRSASGSYGTRVFQNIILGSCEFEATYGLSSSYHGRSLLKTEDRVIINEYSVAALERLNSRSGIKSAIYTARPSHPPADLGLLKGYSPEAEMALQAAGLQNYPLVGMGMMEWLAERHGERSEDLTKPNTTHCLSALLAALAQSSQSHVLERAYNLDRNPESLRSLGRAEFAEKSIRIFVFEDTSSGIKPVLRLADKLRGCGYDVTATAFGISANESKRAALSPLCLRVFDDVNQALDHLFQEISQV